MAYFSDFVLALQLKFVSKSMVSSKEYSLFSLIIIFAYIKSLRNIGSPEFLMLRIIWIFFYKEKFMFFLYADLFYLFDLEKICLA